MTFAKEELQFPLRIWFLITQITLKPALHDTTDAVMQKLTLQYVMINCVNAFQKSRLLLLLLLVKKVGNARPGESD